MKNNEDIECPMVEAGNLGTGRSLTGPPRGAAWQRPTQRPSRPPLFAWALDIGQARQCPHHPSPYEEADAECSECKRYASELTTILEKVITELNVYQRNLDPARSASTRASAAQIIPFFEWHCEPCRPPTKPLPRLMPRQTLR